MKHNTDTDNASSPRSLYPLVDAMTTAQLDDFIERGEASQDEYDYAVKLRRKRSKNK